MIFFFFLTGSSAFVLPSAGLFPACLSPEAFFSGTGFSPVTFSADTLFSTPASIVFSAFSTCFCPLSSFLNRPRTRSIASSSMELCAAFTSIPFSFRYVIISLLCISSSLASSCTFIFAIYYSPSYSRSASVSSIRFRIESASPLSVMARFTRISFPIACPNASLFP